MWSRSDHEGDLWKVLSPNQVLDNITLYWLSRTGASSARLYWESIAEVTSWFTRPGGEPITEPTGCTVFPQEVPHPYRRWAEPRFPSIVHWGEPPRGGHFGAGNNPGLFISEVRAVAEALDQPGLTARTTGNRLEGKLIQSTTLIGGRETDEGHRRWRRLYLHTRARRRDRAAHSGLFGVDELVLTDPAEERLKLVAGISQRIFAETRLFRAHHIHY